MGNSGWARQTNRVTAGDRQKLVKFGTVPPGGEYGPKLEFDDQAKGMFADAKKTMWDRAREFHPQDQNNWQILEEQIALDREQFNLYGIRSFQGKILNEKIKAQMWALKRIEEWNNDEDFS